MNKGMDKFNQVFYTMEEFVDFLEAREENTKRLTVSANQLKFVTMAHSLKYYSVAELSARMSVEEDLIQDTIENADIIVVVDGVPYLMGSSSWISVKNRIEIFGRGFDLLESAEQVKPINARMQQLGDKKVQVIIVEGKIRAIMSDEYAVVEASELFKAVVDHILSRFDSYDVIQGYVDHTVSRIKLLMPEMNSELNGLYNLPDEYTPGIIIETSDNGYSANKIGPYWKTKRGSFIKTNEYIYMQHKGETSLEKIIEELPNLFLKYQNTLKKFASLMTITIDASDVKKVVRKAGKHIGLSKRLIKQLVEQVDQTYLMTPGIVTAYDICREILSAPTLVDDNQKTDIEEKAGKAINLNYAALAQEEDD